MSEPTKIMKQYMKIGGTAYEVHAITEAAAVDGLYDAVEELVANSATLAEQLDVIATIEDRLDSDIQSIQSDVDSKISASDANGNASISDSSSTYSLRVTDSGVNVLYNGVTIAASATKDLTSAPVIQASTAVKIGSSTPYTICQDSSGGIYFK